MRIMLKKLIILSSLLLPLLSCGDETPVIPIIPEVTVEFSGEGHVIHAMGDHNYPPFEYNDKSGVPAGFNIDILRSTAEVMNLRVKIKLGPWNEVRSKLEDREIDLLAGMFKTPERMKRADFTIPHFISTYVIFIRDGSDIKSLENVRGRVVLVQEGDLGHDFIKENGTAGTVITKSELGDVLYALSGGEGDCAIAAAMQGQIIMKEKGIKNLTYITKPLVQRSYCMAVKKGDAELLAKLNEGLNILKSTGDYDRIYEKWFSVYEERRIFNNRYFRLLIQVLILLVAVIAAIYLWNISLKKRVKERELLFKTIFETSPYSIALSRRDNGSFIMVNRAFENFSGVSESEAIGKTPAELGMNIDDNDYRREKDNLLRDSGTGNIMVTISGSNGVQRSGVFSARIIKLQGEDCILTMIVDMTEMMKLEEQLRQSQKMEVIGQLAGGVAHDFNNMLAGITGGAELLMRNVEPESKAARYAEMILNGAERASELTTKLLAFSRMGKMVMKNVNIHDVIVSAIAILERAIDRKITIFSEFKAEENTVKGDVTLLQNAFLNMGLNARDAMPEGGEIFFKTENVTIDEVTGDNQGKGLQPGTYVKISISDTGKGIPEEIKEKIFEPFYTTKAVGKGTGLGLSAVYGTVHDHGGIIEVSSMVDRGSIFTIYLPAGSGIVAADISGSEELFRFSGTVLVIDDEQLVRNTVEGYLREMGFTVITARDGIEGIEIYKERAPEIEFVILDMVMPGISGEETLRHLREIKDDIKVLYSSGFTRQKVMTDYIDGREFFFVQKPYRLSELADAVKRVMNNK